MSRYRGTQIRTNKNELYKDTFKERGVRFINQYVTPKLEHLTEEQIQTLSIVGHVWSYGDRYYKLAQQYYGDSRLWWVIAWFNKAPTESHLSLGDVISIPLPLEEVINFMDV